MTRREFLELGAAAGLACAASAGCRTGAPAAMTRGLTGPAIPPFALQEATIADLQAGMQSGKYTARGLCEYYLTRVDELDGRGPALHSVIETNPEALTTAEQLDTERKTKGPRGPLHGIPVLVKDNIATADRMATTAGSLALVGAKPPADAAVAARLRAAGAVILGKANLSEWANFRSSNSSSGWSARGGQCKNPYALDRSPCGSSSGTAAAIAANFAAVGVGTETDGSIVCPAAACSLVGIKPTLGLVSRTGIVPIAHSQDTAGPMARTVRDAAVLLGALAGADARDAATSAAPTAVPDYTRSLDPKGLDGARIGVARTKLFGYHAATDAVINQAIDVLRRAGAVIVDPADIPHLGEYDDAELTVLLYEFKADLNRYLAEFAPGAPVKTLQDVIVFNERNREREMPYFGQDLFVKAQDKGPPSDQAYRDALDKCRKLGREEGLRATLDQQKLDAIVAPTGNPAWPIDLVNGDHFLGGSSTPAAVAGFPHVTVPAGYVFGLPVGLSFIGAPWSEATLVRLAYAYEQATTLRQPPKFPPTVRVSS
ncbi:MAG: amidase [Gemmatimonadetes bacterium 13_1_40CM_4_69_8]|nr:MAG: amidase [Gemmatimonadetes bacterium 13_1_40CM_4_69_8]